MRNKYLLILLCCVSILFMGCPYNSEVSIDLPTAVKINPRLLGKWQQRSSEDVTYIVTQKNDFTYSILEKHKPQEGSSDKSSSDDKTYNAFLSDVDGTTFINISDADTAQLSKAYYFYKIEFSQETEGFTMFPVTEYITEKFDNSSDLKKFVQQYKGLSFFYGTKEEYIKVGK